MASSADVCNDVLGVRQGIVVGHVTNYQLIGDSWLWLEGEGVLGISKSCGDRPYGVRGCGCKVGCYLSFGDIMRGLWKEFVNLLVT